MKAIALLTVIAIAGTGCTHALGARPRVHVISDNTDEHAFGLATGGSGIDLCQREHEQCVERCWNKKNWPYPHNKSQSGWYLKRCEHDCGEQFRQCEEEQEETAKRHGQKLEFTRMDEALEWLKLHKRELVIGTVVVVAGVAFVITTGGTGALLLVPLAL